jgi:hypothetical protein
MKERWIDISTDVEERQEQFFQTWLSGDDIPFEGQESSLLYKERVTIIKDAIQLKKRPYRVPVCPSAGFFPFQYGGISAYEAHYDYEKLIEVWERFYIDFDPDSYSSPAMIIPGRVLDLLDYGLYHWPGHGIGKENTYQFVEGEYMKPEEYRDFIDDPTGFFINKYFPRIAGSLKPLEKMPLLPPLHELPPIPMGILPFGLPEVQDAMRTLLDAGNEMVNWFTSVRKLNFSIMGKGYPSMYGGFAKAPFDAIGDSLRGTAGIMLDMFRYPEELLEACERMTPFMIKAGVSAAKTNGNPLVFMPLHKGADGFMSQDQFINFYWPTFRKVIIGLMNEGCVPLLFAEGGYNSRLEVIKDLPRGKAVWWFDQTDMKKAKEILGEVSCIAGNVPLSLLCTSTPNDVRTFCKNLIDVSAKNGGFILSTGAGMDLVRSENVKVMIEAGKEYGSYRQ